MHSLRQEQADVVVVPLQDFFCFQLVMITGETDHVGLNGVFVVFTAGIEGDNHGDDAEPFIVVRAETP